MSNNINKKATILVHTDTPVASTGFGRVCYSLVTRWLMTNKYRIVVLGMNDRGEHHPLRNAHPDLIIEPLPYLSEDPYGMQRLPEILRKYEPDIVFSLNDIFVLSGDQRHPQMLNWYKRTLDAYKPFMPWVGYFAVDGRPWEKLWVDMANSMTYAVVFSDYGIKVLEETEGVDMSKVRKIYHGHDTQNFYPVPKEESLKIRTDMGLKADDFLIGVVQRSQPRKNIPAIIQAFKMFRDGYVKCDECGHPRNLEVIKDCEICGSYGFSEEVKGVGSKAFLYLHMNPMDGRGYRLPKIQSDNKASGVITRANFDVANGVPIQELNLIYNACDVTVNPTTGAGYELTTAESMSAGTPTIATRTTAIIEQLQDGRGILVRPAEYIILEDAAHCHRHVISLQGLIDALFFIYENPLKAREMAEKAIPFAKSRNWDDSAKQFEELFDTIMLDRVNLDEKLDSEKVNALIVNNSDNMGNILSMLPSLKLVVKNNSNLKFKVAANKRFKDLFRDLSSLENLEIIQNDKLWLDRKNLEKFKLSVNDITQVPDQNKNIVNLIGIDGSPSIIDLFSKSFKTFPPVDEFNRLLDVPFSLSNEEKEFASTIYSTLEDKFKLVILVNSKANYMIPTTTLNKTLAFFKTKYSDIVPIIIGNLDSIKDLEASIKIDINEQSIGKIISLLANANCVLASDEEFVHLTNFINTPFVIIQGVNDCKNIVKHSRSVKIDKSDSTNSKKIITFISNKNKYQCMPCFKQNGDRCVVSSTPNANCMETVSPGEIFARICSMRDYWLQTK